MNKTIPKVEVSFRPNRNLSERVYLKSSDEVYKVAIDTWNLDTIELFEEFMAVYLDRRNGIIGIREISRGGTAGTVVDIKIVISIAIACNASGLILLHNHPSGMTSPSHQDISLTDKIKAAAQLFDINLLDHLIITRETYYSFTDNGHI